MVEALKKPELHEQRNIKAINFQMYERYLPSAFDETLSILEKINKMIWKLNELGELTNDMIDKWNKVIQWLLNDGLTDAIIDQLNRWKEDGTLEEIINQEIFGKLNAKIDELVDRLENTPIELTVGAKGDFSKLQKAIDHVIDFSIKPTKATIILLNDYVMEEQISIKNQDLRFVEIYSENTVNVRVNRSDLLNETGENYVPVIYGKNTNMPTINTKFAYKLAKTSENKFIVGVYLDNCTLYMEPHNGFIGYPYMGLVASNNSRVTANGCDFTGNGVLSDEHGAGVKIQRSGLTADDSIANECGEYGYWIQGASSARLNRSTAKKCGHHNLVLSHSSNVTANNCTFTDSPDNNVVITTNSILDLSESDCSRAGANNIVAQKNSMLYFNDGVSNESGISGLNITQHSWAQAEGATLNNNERNGLDSKDGSDVNFKNGKANGNKKSGFYILNGSHVMARTAEINNNADEGIHCYSGFCDCYKADIKNNGRDGIRSYNGGRVVAYKANIRDSGVVGLHASRGEIWCGKATSKNNNGIDVKASYGSKVSCSELHTTSGDVQTLDCTSSSIIQANRIHGSAKANKPKNEINNQGIIFSNI